MWVCGWGNLLYYSESKQRPGSLNCSEGRAEGGGEWVAREEWWWWGGLLYYSESKQRPWSLNCSEYESKQRPGSLNCSEGRAEEGGEWVARGGLVCMGAWV